MRADWRRLRPWPRSLAGQLIALLLLALIASHLIAGALFVGERRDALLAAQREQVLARTATAVRLLAATPPAQARRLLRAASSPELRFRVTPRPPVPAAAMDSRLERRLAAALAARLAGSGAGAPRVALGRLPHHEGMPGDMSGGMPGGMRGRMPERGPERGPGPGWHGAFGLTLAVPLDAASGEAGLWLEARTLAPLRAPGWAGPAVVALAVSALAISLVVVLTVRRVTRPLRGLADAAEAFGRGEPGAPLAVAGPAEARRTIAAFNEMRARIRRFVDDRLRLLAAISHDLRTPITALRLRAELVEDEETRARMLETLEELQRMVEATLRFAREESASEPTRRVDLAALVESLVADFAELGRPVRYQGPESLPASLRPDALRRALRNLIDNALTYGAAAEVRLAPGPAGVEICVDDRGPGIPPEARERVFDPFQRLEDSRSRETGGVGLGLSIARSIARGHGGDLTLHDAPGGGLRARLWLPAGATAAR